MKRVEIKFVGIDSWNRPIFKDITKREYYGDYDNLFDYDATEKDVLQKIDETCLTYFGNSFGCEPMGSPAIGLKIISEFKPNKIYRGRLNKQGNWVTDDFKMFCSRYYYDRAFQDDPDWYTVSLDQDAEYFGVWVNDKKFQIVTYCEGDILWVYSLNPVQHHKEYREMMRFYAE